LDEEERTIEITIVLDRPLVIALLIFIIVLEASYIGYLHFFPTSEVGKSSASARESDYWDHEYIETYRGSDIYYFKNINTYGIDTGEPDPMDWEFIGSVETAKGKIDNWFEEPEEIEIYRMWKIYRQAAGTRFYWAEQVKTGEKTTLWVNLDDLKRYIDEL